MKVVGYGAWPRTTDAAPGPQPLPAAAPATWKEREDRVSWCLAHLTLGEKALLYRLLHDVEGHRTADCRDKVSKERKTCASPT